LIVLLYISLDTATFREVSDDDQSSRSEAHDSVLLQLNSAASRTSPSKPAPALSVAQGSDGKTAVFGATTPAADNMKEAYLSLLLMALTGSLTDEAGACDVFSKGGCSVVRSFDPVERMKGNDWPPWGQTMVGHLRLLNVRTAIEDTVKNNVPGDFVELGTWRGGTCIFAKAIFNVMGETSRKVHLFDAFEKIQSYDTTQGNFVDFLAATQDSVSHNFQKFGVLDDNVEFHKGLFKNTVPAFVAANPNLQLSVLRIDGNFYDSYQDALYYLFPLVPVGGYVIFDDVFVNNGDEAIMQCWLDFKKDNSVPEELTRIDDVSAYFKKTVDTKIDRAHMKTPRDSNLQ